MKRALFLIAAFCFAGRALAQYPVARATSSFQLVGGNRTTDTYAVLNWSAFAADSSATVSTGNFSNAEYDSIQVWVYATSATANPKFSGVIKGTFPLVPGSSQAQSWVTVGTAADTTNTRLGALYRVGTVYPLGAATMRVSLTGSIVGGATYGPNRTDDVINIWLVCYRHVGDIQQRR